MVCPLLVLCAENVVCPLLFSPKPDRRAILEALKRGEEVPGARLAQGVRVEIR